MKIDWSDAEQVKEYHRKWMQNKYASDAQYRLEKLKREKEKYESDAGYRAAKLKYAKFYRGQPENKQAQKAYQKEYQVSPKFREYKKNYVARQRATSIHFRLKNLVNGLLQKTLKRNGISKRAKSVVLIGCSIADFRAHTEKLFWPGMNWSNQGRWQLDHIKPCASFNLSDPAQQAACFHWSNWQPLWADDNMIKSDRLDWHPAESRHSLPTRLVLKPWDCEGLEINALNR